MKQYDEYDLHMIFIEYKYHYNNPTDEWHNIYYSYIINSVQERGKHVCWNIMQISTIQMLLIENNLRQRGIIIGRWQVAWDRWILYGHYYDCLLLNV